MKNRNIHKIMHLTPSNATHQLVTREGKCFTKRKITIRREAHASVHTNKLTIVLLFSIYKQLQSLSTYKIRNYIMIWHTMPKHLQHLQYFILEGFVLCTWFSYTRHQINTLPNSVEDKLLYFKIKSSIYIFFKFSIS